MWDVCIYRRKIADKQRIEIVMREYIREGSYKDTCTHARQRSREEKTETDRQTDRGQEQWQYLLFVNNVYLWND